MRTYGKALSTYRRINNIKSSVNRIGEAQNMISEQRARAIDEAQRIQRQNAMTNSIVQGSIQLGSAGLQAFAKTEDFSNRVRDISTGVSAAAGIATNAASQISSNRMLGGTKGDTIAAGLGQEGFTALKNSFNNPLNSALNTFALNEQISSARLSGGIKSMLDKLDSMPSSANRNQTRRFLTDEIGWGVFTQDPNSIRSALESYMQNRHVIRD